MRGEDPRGHHGERSANSLRWLLLSARPTAADRVRAGLPVDRALALVDAEAYRDARLVGLPRLPSEMRVG